MEIILWAGAQAAGRLRERPPAKLYPVKRQGQASFGGGPAIDQSISSQQSLRKAGTNIGSYLAY